MFSHAMLKANPPTPIQRTQSVTGNAAQKNHSGFQSHAAMDRERRQASQPQPDECRPALLGTIEPLARLCGADAVVDADRKEHEAETDESRT